jgi:hypothetical protein
VFDDNAVKREILSLKVDCTNNVTNNCLNKCEWSGELRELQVNKIKHNNIPSKEEKFVINYIQKT